MNTFVYIDGRAGVEEHRPEPVEEHRPEPARPGHPMNTFVYIDARAGVEEHRPEPVEGRLSQRPPVTLDVGCGPGLLSALFAKNGCQSFGVDYDFGMLSSGLVPALVQADAFSLPFGSSTFDLVTATNLLFLLEEPLRPLREWRRVLAPGGELCLLNPSENLSLAAATRLADERGLDGAARKSLLNWAHNAETHFRWTENETRELLSRAGLRLEETVLRVGPGFARFARARFH